MDPTDPDSDPQHCFLKLRKSANFWVLSLSQIRKFLRCASPQMLFRKFRMRIHKLSQNTTQFKTLSQNSSIICIVKMTFLFLLQIGIDKFVRRKSIYLHEFQVGKKIWIRKSEIYKLQICKSQKRLGPQIANQQGATNYLSPQIFGFAICGTYLRTAHLCHVQ
jgi:hypothetical protein